MPTTSRRIARRGMLVTALAIAAGLCFAFCAGCQSPTTADEWSAEYETAWQDVLGCWQSKGLDTRKANRPGVIVRGDCRSYWPKQDYAVGNEYFFGRYFIGSNDVEVCPDLGALRHEMSHSVLARVTGDAGDNGGGKKFGCYSVIQ